MTYRSQRTQHTSQTGTHRTRECKVCIDAGKSFEEYTSHWVKDRNGNVACPTLLNQKCLVCGTCGHTASYCKTTIESSGSTFIAVKKPDTSMQTVSRQSRQSTQSRPASSNKYALLGLMDQEAQEKEREIMNTFPSLPPPELEKKPVITRPATSIIATTGAIVSWANRLNAPPSPTILQEQQQQEPSQRKPTRSKPVQISISWGDRCE